jgi:selenophosphate synthetase-related protein
MDLTATAIARLDVRLLRQTEHISAANVVVEVRESGQHWFSGNEAVRFYEDCSACSVAL